MIKGFYFFDSYRSALKKYQEAGDDKSQVFLIHAICDYVFEGIEPKDFPRADLQVIWELLLPHLNNSIAIEKNRLQRQEAGRKGGKQNRSKTEAKQKQTESKTEANGKQTESKTEANPKLNKNKNKNNYNKSKSFDDFEQRIMSEDDFDGLEKSLVTEITTGCTVVHSGV